jgi:hypothetical protein
MFATALVLLASFAAFAAGCESQEISSTSRRTDDNLRQSNRSAEQTRNRIVPRRDSIDPFEYRFQAKFGRQPIRKPSAK